MWSRGGYSWSSSPKKKINDEISNDSVAYQLSPPQKEASKDKQWRNTDFVLGSLYGTKVVYDVPWVENNASDKLK